MRYALIVLLFSSHSWVARSPGPMLPEGCPDLTGQGRKEYVCPPCGCRGDDASHDKQGNCPTCGMEMVDRATTMSLSAIPNFLKVSDSVWTGGQPTLAHLGKLKEEGVKAIINLRMHEEHDGAVEAAKAKKLGMTYVNVPVDFDDPKTSDVDSFLKATDELLKNGRVFIHCAAAIRVGAFWMIRRALRDGWEYEEAREEAKQIGLRRDGTWVDFAKTTIDRRRLKGDGK
ncbi:MAG TPA: sulfur transferase domain-containing protein [Bacteroidota bacterium]|nr:sulfur transferase domain-containing protein [Bacteroidota bacterium]